MSKLMSKLMQMTVVIAMLGMMNGCSDDKQVSAGGAENVIKVTNWGPRATQAGKGFSIQPNGDSAIWFEFSGPGNAKNLEVWFGDQKLTGVAVIPDKGGSAQVPPNLIATPKTVPVYLVYTTKSTKIELGNFEITP